MKKFITSSADPKQLSLTVKGLLVSIVPLVMLFTGMTQAEINPIIDSIEQVVFFGASLLSAGQVLYGLVRKIKLGKWSADE